MAQVKGKIQEGLYQTVMSSVLDVQTTAKRPGYVPYQTGTLRRSITHKIEQVRDGVVGYVGTNVVYARIQEFGGVTGRNKSVNIKPKLFLTRAVKDNAENIRRKFDRFLKVSKLLK